MNNHTIHAHSFIQSQYQRLSFNRFSALIYHSVQELVHSINKRTIACLLKPMAMFSTMFMIVFTLSQFVLNTHSPISAVLSESMSPGFNRGDVLFVANWNLNSYHTGEIVLFQLKDKPIPIVHRVHKVHKRYF